jgi:hypothetical protein
VTEAVMEGSFRCEPTETDLLFRLGPHRSVVHLQTSQWLLGSRSQDFDAHAQARRADAIAAPHARARCSGTDPGSGKPYPESGRKVRRIKQGAPDGASSFSVTSGGGYAPGGTQDPWLDGDGGVEAHVYSPRKRIGFVDVSRRCAGPRGRGALRGMHQGRPWWGSVAMWRAARQRRAV